VDRYKGDVKENEMKKLQVVLGKTTLLACVLAVMAGGCSKDKSSDKSGHENGGVAGESDVGGNAGSGGDSGGESSNGGTSGGKSSAGGTSSATSSSENSGGTAGSAGSSGAGGATAGITALSVKTEQTSLRGLVEQTLTLDVTVDRGDESAKGDVTVSAQGLPAGVGSSPVKIATGNNKAQLQIKIGPTAQVGGPYAFSVVATSADDSSVSESIQVVLYIAQKAGALDVSFGNAGTAQITPVLSSEGKAFDASYPWSIAVDSKGRVVAGGNAYLSTDSYGKYTGWVVRLTSNGTLDTTFANTGRLNNFGLPYSSVYGVGFSNEQLYVSAEQIGSVSTSYLRKVTESGTTDPSFNAGLDVTLNSPSKVLTGFKGGMLVDNLELIQANGAVDSFFSAPTRPWWVERLAVDSQERVLYAGAPTNSGFNIGRLLSTGEADSTFGTNGEVTSLCPTDGEMTDAGSVRAVLAMPNQSVVALVNCGVDARDTYNWQAALVAFSPTGQPVRGFGNNGRLIVNDPGGGKGAVVQPDGKVVVLYSMNSSDSEGYLFEYVLSRYDSSGLLDATFGESGFVKLWSARKSISPVIAYDVSAQRVVVVFPSAGSSSLAMKRVWL
jgi:uncharacterized delta-60 repeat protein